MSEISKLRSKFKYKKIDKETLIFQITDNVMLMSIVGEFDQNLKDLGKLTNTIFFLEAIQLLAKEKKKIQIFL